MGVKLAEQLACYPRSSRTNVRSTRNSNMLIELEILACSQNYDLIGITETSWNNLRELTCTERGGREKGYGVTLF